VLTNESDATQKSNLDFETMPLANVSDSGNVTIQTSRKDRINPDKCKDDDDALYKWQTPYLYQGRNGRLTYGGGTRSGVSYQPQGHHSWPMTLGGDPSQTLITIIDSIHNEEIHYGRSPVGSPVIAVAGSIYHYLTNYLNNSPTFGPNGIDVLQGRRLTHPGGQTSGNPLLIARMQQGDTTARRLASAVRNAMTTYYGLFQAGSHPPVPYSSYRQGLDYSYDHII